MTYDLLITNAVTRSTKAGLTRIAIQNGKIAAIDPNL